MRSLALPCLCLLALPLRAQREVFKLETSPSALTTADAPGLVGTFSGDVGEFVPLP